MPREEGGGGEEEASPTIRVARTAKFLGLTAKIVAGFKFTF